MAVSAAQQPDPVLKLGINNLPISGPDRFSVTRDFMTMRSVGLMQEFTRQDKRLARSMRFEREAQASEASRAQALAQSQRDTAMAWLDLYYQERMLALVKAQRDEICLQVEATEVAYRGGRGSQTEVLAARAALAQVDGLGHPDGPASTRHGSSSHLGAAQLPDSGGTRLDHARS